MPLYSGCFLGNYAKAVLVSAAAFSFFTADFIAYAGETAPKSENAMVETSPRWAELNGAQQKALLPLQTLWPTLEANRKRKWLAIAQHFADMNETSQALAQQRMREWAALTPLQRSQARFSFAQLQQLSSDEKLAKWEAYQALNEEDKQKIPSSKPVML
jgi:hypothetical protein